MVYPLNSAEVRATLDRARNTIPGLNVQIRDHCNGADWAIDPITATIHVNGALPPGDMYATMLEGLAALRGHLCNTPESHPGDELAQRRQRRLVRNTPDFECDGTGLEPTRPPL